MSSEQTQDVMTLPAGRELDALVAERVFGYRWEGQPDYDGNFGGEPVLLPPGETWETLESALPRRGRIAPNGFVYRYSTDLTAAWQVVDKMVANGWAYALVRNPHAPQHGAKFYRGALCLGHSIFDADKHEGHYDVAPTTPLAICRAALAAMEPAHA